MQVSYTKAPKSVCAWCGKKYPAWACSKCKMVLYCGNECQRIHWIKDHIKSCSLSSAFTITKTYEQKCHGIQHHYHRHHHYHRQFDDDDDNALLCGSVLTSPSEHTCMDPTKQWGKDRPHGFMKRYIMDKQDVPNMKPGIKLNSEYTVTSRLGSGTYGIVYKISDQNNKVIAMKITQQSEREIPSEFYHDIEARNTDHPNVIGSCYVGTMVDQKSIEREYFMMFMDKAEMSLDGFLDKTMEEINTVKKTTPNAKNVVVVDRAYDNLVLCAYQCALGLGFINTRHMVATNDFKPENILVYGESIHPLKKAGEKDEIIPVCAVADFGLSSPYITEDIQCSAMYTIWYRSPEAIVGDYIPSLQKEIWALGCTIFQILTGGELLFPKRDNEEQLDNIFTALGTPTDTNDPMFDNVREFKKKEYISKQTMYPKHIAPLVSVFDDNEILVKNFSPEARSLLKGMIVRDPSKRMNIYDVIHHPFFKTEKLRDTRFGETAFDVINNFMPKAHFKELLEFHQKTSPQYVIPSIPGVMTQNIKASSIILAYDAINRKDPLLLEELNEQEKEFNDAYKMSISIIFDAWSRTKNYTSSRSVPSVAIDIIRCFYSKYPAWKDANNKQQKKAMKPFAYDETSAIFLALGAFMIALKYAEPQGPIYVHSELIKRVLPAYYTAEWFRRASEAEWEIATVLDFDIHRPHAYVYASALYKMCVETIGEDALVKNIHKDILVLLIVAISRSIKLSKNLTPFEIAKLALSACILPGRVLLDPWGEKIGINYGFDTIEVSNAIYDLLSSDTENSINQYAKETLESIAKNAIKV